MEWEELRISDLNPFVSMKNLLFRYLLVLFNYSFLVRSKSGRF
jgi:hypothetical protein